MSTVTEARARWDTREYRRIVSATHDGEDLHVRYEDGTHVRVNAQRVLPPHVHSVDWDAMTFDAYEIILPIPDGEVEVPWSAIRSLTDREYSAHLAAAAEQQAKLIGLRIKELRQHRSLTGKELAERAGITPQSLSRIEHGHHDVVFSTLQRILTAMGSSLKDLAVAAGERIGAPPAASK